MRTFRRKPIEVQAVQYREQLHYPDFGRSCPIEGLCFSSWHDGMKVPGPHVHMDDAHMALVADGDWLIKDPTSRAAIYVCPPGQFAERYEAVEEPVTA